MDPQDYLRRSGLLALISRPNVLEETEYSLRDLLANEFFRVPPKMVMGKDDRETGKAAYRSHTIQTVLTVLHVCLSVD